MANPELPTPNSLAIVALSIDLQADTALGAEPPTEIRLVPAGSFRARDGRPAEVPAWRMTADLAQRAIAWAQAQTDDPVIDYEHQTLHATANGQPAPAAGWWTAAGMQWRDGEQPGLWATGLTWTERAAAMIRAREYRYFSPVIAYDQHTGAVGAVLMGALTNRAAVDGLSDLAPAALAAYARALPYSFDNEVVVPGENELREVIVRFLRVPVTITNAELRAELTKLSDLVTGADATAPLATVLADQQARLATLTADLATAKAAPDPTTWVPLAVHHEALAALRASAAHGTASEIEQLLTAGLADGRIPGQATADWLRQRGLAALTAYLAEAPAIAALTQTQVKPGQTPTADPAALSASERAVAQGLGLTDDQYRAAREVTK